MGNFYLYFNIFTLINLFVIFSILFFRKNNSVANRVLALIVINPGLNFLNNILIQSGLIFKAPAFLFIFQGTMLLYAPLVLAYANILMGRKIKWFTVLHIVTLAIILLDIYYAIEFSLMPANFKIKYLQGLTNENYPEQMNIINGLFVLVMMVYFVVALVSISKYIKAVKGFFSDIEKVKIQYLKHFVVLLTVLNTVLSIVYAAIPTPAVEYFFIPLFINIIYIYIVYYAFNHSAILTKPEYCSFVSTVDSMERHQQFQEPLCKEIIEIKEAAKTGNIKYKLTQIEIEENYQKLLKYFEDKKPYLDKSINLTKLSNDLNACSHNISLTINTKFDKTFFDLINSYRVEEAKQLLKSIKSNQLTIEAIGMEAGFNSKTAFYRAFKKCTQLTPSEYLNNSLN